MTGTHTHVMQEAATVKAALLRMAKDMETVLADRTVPEDLRKEIQDVRVALRKRWDDLELEANGDAEKEPAEEPTEEPAEEQALLTGSIAERTMVSLPTGEKIRLSELVAVYLSEQEKKTEGGEKYPSSAYLVVEDEDKPTSWHLRVRDADGALDHRLMGAAWAALHGGYRGSKYEGPDKEKAISKLKKLYDEEDMPLPGEAKESLAESMSGNVVGIVEPLVEQEDEALCLVDIVPIEPGWGNPKDNHYYPAKTLRDSAPLFEGVKMYATNHNKSEQNVRNEVAQIIKSPVAFTETGAPIARAAIYDRDFEHSIRKRAKAGRLGDLACSIMADGNVREGFQQGDRAGKEVLAITGVQSVDWVSRAGAGGRALRLVESDTGADNMAEEQTIEVAEDDVTHAVLQEQAELGVADVLTALLEADLPQPVAVRLAKDSYTTLEALTEAITGAKAEVEAVRGEPKRGSRAFGVAGTPPKTEVQESAEEQEKTYRKRLAELGISVTKGA